MISNALAEVAVIGIDIGKNTFHAIGLNDGPEQVGSKPRPDTLMQEPKQERRNHLQHTAGPYIRGMTDPAVLRKMTAYCPFSL